MLNALKAMKTLIITTALLLISLVAFGQSKTKIVKIVKEFPCYEVIGNSAFASSKQIKTTDSLKKIGFMPMGVYATGKGTIKVTFFKAVKK